MLTLTATDLALLVAAIGLGGVVLGALVTGGLALLNAAMESRRERRRWLRDRRVEAVVDNVAAMNASVVEYLATGRMTDDAVREGIRSGTAVQLYGPREVRAAALDARIAIDALLRAGWRGKKANDANRTYQAARDHLIAETQRALGIPLTPPPKRTYDPAGPVQMARKP